MAPMLLIDKSVLQALTMDEARALWRHYQVLICPTLIHEIAGNLLKGVDEPSESTIKRVCDLASKARGIGSRTIGNFEALALNDMLYRPIKMRPQIARADGLAILNSDGTKSLFFEESLEGQLLNRWSEGLFTKEDLTLARNHINLKEIDFSKFKESLSRSFLNYPKDKSLDDIKKFVTSLDLNNPNPWDAIEFYAGNLGLVIFEFPKLKRRWRSE